VPQSYLDEYDVDTIFKNAEIYDMISPHLKNKDEAYKLKVLKVRVRRHHHCTMSVVTHPRFRSVGRTPVWQAIEDPGVVGEMLTSAAPFDPSFWPIHGQLERILGLKRARKSQNALKFDETWGFGGASGKFLSGVCDWSRIESVSDLTLPECDFTGAKTCLGHGEHDTLEFTNFLDLKVRATVVQWSTGTVCAGVLTCDVSSVSPPVHDLSSGNVHQRGVLRVRAPVERLVALHVRQVRL
jgi:hypothetical protein